MRVTGYFRLVIARQAWNCARYTEDISDIHILFILQVLPVAPQHQCITFKCTSFLCVTVPVCHIFLLANLSDGYCHAFSISKRSHKEMRPVL